MGTSDEVIAILGAFVGLTCFEVRLAVQSLVNLGPGVLLGLQYELKITELLRWPQHEREIANRYVMREDQPTSRMSRRRQTGYLVEAEETGLGNLPKCCLDQVKDKGV